MRYTLGIVLILAGLASATVLAPARNQLLKFEVASIKLNVPTPTTMGAQFLPGGRFMASGTTIVDADLDGLQGIFPDRSALRNWIG